MSSDIIALPTADVEVLK
jgi:hypothetical protein